MITLIYLASIFTTLIWTFHGWNTLGLDETGAIPARDLRGKLRKRPLTGQKYVTTSGPYRGMSYTLVVKDGRKYRMYENGSKVLVGNPSAAAIAYPSC